MDGFIDVVNQVMESINAVLWHDYVLYTVLAVGVLFLVWSKFSPWLALTHGIAVVRGKYDHSNDPGAISHFEALSAALSATVGLGNIGGVAVAISLGGPGAVFWMWVVGGIGMAIKTVEVTQSMLYRNTSEKNNPHGGPMFVVRDGLKKFSPKLATAGSVIGGIFCITLLVSTVTGGNMFQAWNVGKVTYQNFGVPDVITGLVLAIICGLVIIGGIKRIGAVAGKLVPFMCGIYLIASIYVLILNYGSIPEMLRLIVYSAFNPTEAEGAFLGGTFGYAFLWGMKRALFSNEAGQGSAPIAHSAAMTDEPVREGIVAGLEPFIDTIVVCTLTALVILGSGAWNRSADFHWEANPDIIELSTGAWTLSSVPIPDGTPGIQEGQDVFMVMQTDALNERTGSNLYKVFGLVVERNQELIVEWGKISSEVKPIHADGGLYVNYVGAALTSFAFDSVHAGLGKWLVTIAAWLFAISTMISWSYYGEQGIVYLFGQRWVPGYKIIYCSLIVAATSGFITTDRELDNMTGIGTGLMLFANIPIMLLFAKQSMSRYHTYVAELKAGKFKRS